MATAYHNEALRKQRVIERKKEATRRFIDQHGQVGQNHAPVDAAPKKDKILYSEPGHYEQNRTGLQKFRVNEEGFNNRYRNRQNHVPHCDVVYSVIYPGNDNSDYTADENKTHRRYNKNMDNYQISAKVNGNFHVEVLKQTPP
ncbi:hypothetical protein ACJMK2_033738 [Sinanodonta woodiana]|uniref:Uncharacterized protein n=1 Tax=Sinanodonta woodiana TaxID=1069815 RepID=A0ABD3WPA3_SINWO